MVYGDIYSQLSPKILSEISGINNSLFLIITKIYFRIFGYPDLASSGRFPVVLDLLRPKKQEMILDAGCGNGIYANTIAYKYGVNVIGIDIDDKRLKIAQKIARFFRNKTIFLKKDLEKDNFLKNKFDKILLLEVIEHIKNDKALIKKLSNSLKKGGILILSTPKKENLTTTEERNRYQKVVKGEHVRSGYTLLELRKILLAGGIRIKEWQPYYRLISRLLINIQQKIYLKNYFLLNIISYPIFFFLSKFDLLLGKSKHWNNHFGWYRGYVIRAVKQ